MDKFILKTINSNFKVDDTKIIIKMLEIMDRYPNKQDSSKRRGEIEKVINEADI